MTNKQKQHLSKEELTEASILYEEKGWKVLWIAKKFNIDHTAILYYIKKRNWIRTFSVLEKRPLEVEKIYRQAAYSIDDESENEFEYSTDISQVKSYRAIVKEASIRREDYLDTECSHAYWTKRCSMCKMILESDSRTNATSSTEPVKMIYHEFDSSVCPYDIALELQRLKIRQHSMLYWVFFEDNNILTLRVRMNIPEVTNENAIIASAFTTQELFTLLLRLPVTLRDASFMNKLALNGNNPIYLGKLLCRSFRKLERTRFRKTPQFKQALENTDVPESINKLQCTQKTISDVQTISSSQKEEI